MENGLKLVLRSHEGPDARFERDDMASMQEGWTTDHVVEAGRLLTVFRHADSLTAEPQQAAVVGVLTITQAGTAQRHGCQGRCSREDQGFLMAWIAHGVEGPLVGWLSEWGLVHAQRPRLPAVPGRRHDAPTATWRQWQC